MSSYTSNSPRQSVSLALKIASLPPLAMGSPANEKDQLPCIMITPSSPVHEYDYQLIKFQTPEPKPGFVSSVQRLFSSSSSSQIALPPTPVLPIGSSSALPSRNNRFSSKRFRFILILLALAFFAVHLLFLPKFDNGLYEVFQSHSPHNFVDDVIATWEDSKGHVVDAVASPTITSPAHSAALL